MKKALALLAVCLLALFGCAMAEPLADGEYAPAGFSFTGGSGRVTISCPRVCVSGGAVTATLVFSSPNYPVLTVDGVEYAAAHDGDTSIFVIPARLDADMALVGTTTAMSQPHDVEYVIHIYMNEAAPQAAEAGETAGQETPTALAERERALPGLNWQSELPLRYATQFAVDRYEGGYRLLSIADGTRWLVVPEGGAVPDGLDGDIRVVRQPLRCVYLAATSAMALIDAVGGLDAVRLSGTRAEGWTIANARAAMEKGDMLYAGKYSAPDYELLVGMGCDLAVESTMILHAPKVREMIEQLGIPVFVERSSYESHPLGRTEWVKLYGALLGREAQADAFFEAQAAAIDALSHYPNTEKTVAFFYVASDGGVVVRGANDYVARMIELAGGRYVFRDPQALHSDRASVSISMEDFYAAAVDADLLIYNASVDAPLQSVDELLAKNPVFADFRAVREGNVWSTDKSLYQSADIAGEIIADIHRALTGGEGGTGTIHRLT